VRADVIFHETQPRCMQRGLVTIKLPVRLSDCQTCDLWQNERNLCPHSYTSWKKRLS